MAFWQNILYKFLYLLGIDYAHVTAIAKRS